jgi:hypothetical protein
LWAQPERTILGRDNAACKEAWRPHNKQHIDNKTSEKQSVVT